MQAVSVTADANHSFGQQSEYSSMSEHTLSPEQYLSKFSTSLKKKDGTDYRYFTGNSLGLQPKTTEKYVNEELEIWRQYGVEGHFHEHVSRPWVKTDDFVREKMAKVVGAEAEEIAVMNSLTANLHFMMIPFYRPDKQRHKLIVEAGCFPSDQYAVESQVMLHGLDTKTSLVELSPRQGEHCLRTDDILEAIEKHGDQTALIMLSGVQYYTGQLFDIPGCKVGWDLAHAVGNVQLELHEWNVDFAAWCTYKYLNSGPGNIGGCFVHRRNFQAEPRLKGWWGHTLDSRFNMRQPFHSEVGAYGFRLSNPPVLCVAALLASLEIFEAAGMEALVAKQRLLTMYLELLLRKLPLTIMTPKNPQERGCQLSLLFTPGQLDAVHTSISDSGFIADKREPDCMRVAPAPLYNSFEDVRQLYLALADALTKLNSAKE